MESEPSESGRRRPGPPEPRVQLDVPWDEAVAKMIRTPPMPEGEKRKRPKPRNSGDDG